MGWAPQRGDIDPVEHMHTSFETAAATEPAPPSVPEPVGPSPAPAGWRRIVVGGWAFAAGAIAVTGVTFPTPGRPGAPAGVDIRTVNHMNTAGEPAVLTDPGFAPDPEGFTLAVCAAEPGPFLAEVRYCHVDGGATAPQPEGERPR